MKSYHDIVGDGGSDVVGQVAAHQQRIARNLAGVRRKIAIGSGKGGVGKSTLTFRIALALRAKGASVTILDADWNGPSQARLAGLRVAPPVPGERGFVVPRGISGIGVVSLGAFIPEGTAIDFESVAPNESQTWRGTREFTLLGEILAGADWGEVDFLLFDLPPGADRTFQLGQFLGPDVDFVLVTVPSALSRGVVARSVAALEKLPNRVLGTIENMSGYACPDCGSVKPLFPPTEGAELGLPSLGRVPFTPDLAAASDEGRADGGGASTDAIAAIAARLLATV